MAFIRYRNLKTDASGRATSGSAAILECRYDRDSLHQSRQIFREALGRVVWIAQDKKTGIFLSSTRGLVEYSSETDSFDEVDGSDERLEGTGLSGSPTFHAIFGDSYWMMAFLEKFHLGEILRKAYPNKRFYQRTLCHVLHSILKNGAKVSCDTFVAGSFLSNLMPKISLATLRSDSSFFLKMGEDKNKMVFFKTFVEAKRKENPTFGRCCYVDSTPLPNDIENNPFNAFCNHGTGGAVLQSRLVLILDESSGLPIWYTVIPGNLLDINTLRTVIKDVEASLDVTVGSMVLDAGYVSKELIEKIHVGVAGRTFVAKMPARKGYPYDELYTSNVKPFISQGKYQIVRKSHLYFGTCRKTKIFGYDMFAYPYVDFDNAISGAKQYMKKYPEEVDKMSESERDWLWIKSGYFVLLSNEEHTPEELLSSYYGRTEIENVFKTGKEYLGLLPLAKWTAERVCGKILVDIIGTIIFLHMMKVIAPTKYDVPDVIETLKSLKCQLNSTNEILVETANPKTRALYALLDILPPAAVNLEKVREEWGI